MLQKLKLTKTNMALIFFALFPIMPSYFQVVGIAVVNILCICEIIITIGHSNNRYVKVSIFGTAVVLWLLWLSFVSILHSDMMSAIVNVLYIGACAGVAKTLNSEEKINKAINVIILVASIVGFFGIIESLSGFNIFSLINTSGIRLNYNPPRFGLIRIISSQGNAIEYCLYCMFALFLTFYRYVNLNKGKEKRKVLICYWIIFMNAVLTLSRSALLCLFVGQILLLYFSGHKVFLKTILKVGILAVILGLFLYIVFPPFSNMLKQIIFMFLAIFNDSYETAISGAFGNDNLSAFGNRIDLYEWVIQDMKGNFLFGMGGSTKFNHPFTATSGIYEYTVIKESIEVDYLSTLWRTGVVGMLLKILAILSLLIKTYKSKKFDLRNESVLPFSRMCFLCVLCYIVAWFAIAQGTEFKMFISIVAIFVACRRLDKAKLTR